MGGLNIRRATLYTSTAFIGSLHQCESLIDDILVSLAKALQHLPHAISLAPLMRPASLPFWKVPLMSAQDAHPIIHPSCW